VVKGAEHMIGEECPRSPTRSDRFDYIEQQSAWSVWNHCL